MTPHEHVEVVEDVRSEAELGVDVAHDFEWRRLDGRDGWWLLKLCCLGVRQVGRQGGVRSLALSILRLSSLGRSQGWWDDNWIHLRDGF